MAKLDAEVRVLLSWKQYFDQHPAAGTLSVGPNDPLYVAIKFQGDVSALVAAGLTPRQHTRANRVWSEPRWLASKRWRRTRKSLLYCHGHLASREVCWR